MGLHKFNKEWELRKLKFKQNRSKYIRLGTLVLSVFILVMGIIYFTYSKFTTTNKFDVVNAKVGNFNSGDLTLAVYLDGTKANTFPTSSSGYVFDSSNSSCNNSATISWDNTNWAPTINNLTTSGTKCNFYFKDAKLSTYLTSIQSSNTSSMYYDETTDNNLRYYGATPNNYISFNGELWRIIGVMNNMSDGDGNTGLSLVKIVRNESFGNYNYSSSSYNGGGGANEWSTSIVKDLLNTGIFYTSLSTNSVSIIQNVQWKIGANPGEDFTSNTISITKFYSYERGTYTGKQCNSNYYCSDSITRTTSWIGNVSLIYPSDYGFAIGSSNNANASLCFQNYHSWSSTTYSYCNQNNWLYKANITGWTPIALGNPNGGGADREWQFSDSGIIHNSSSSSANVFPSLYLKSNVKYVSGTGTSADPIIISQ